MGQSKNAKKSTVPPLEHRPLKLVRLKDQAVITDQCVVAKSYFARLQGLIGRSRMEAGEGMLFPKCNDIHMWFMRIPLDVVFLRLSERGFVVSSVRENVRPWRVLPLHDFKATETLELPAGTVARLGLQTGDELCSG